MALLLLMLQILAQDLERCAQSYLETHHRGTVTANWGERSPATAQLAQHCCSEFPGTVCVFVGVSAQSSPIYEAKHMETSV